MMVYGNDPTLYDRIGEYRKQGYRVHLMTGMAWGNYQDYLYGKWDGRSHWSEAQVRADGQIVGHGKDIPYMVPTVSFADYISESLRKAVDAGVEAIHLEEPEFWDFSGYSKAFRDEYAIYYREPWQDPQQDIATHYKCAQLKAYLYARAIRRVADSIKEYSYQKFGKAVRVYIPTHSLINYTQWKIMSPEGLLNDIPSLDGFIAQVWTGTSRTQNMYRGKLAERTFETAYCEFSIMQELVKKSNKQMWFLADPIEDNPRYDWSDYRKNYFETVIASLLHPEVHHYEVCPWPNRVFNGKYPKNNRSDDKEVEDKSKPIPETYRTQLINMFQTLCNMDQPDYRFAENNEIHLGVALSDTGLYQRSYPQGVLSDSKGDLKETFDFYSSDAFPMFYGLALPLVKHGMPIRCVQIDNVLRSSNYLSDLKYLILSYDFMKPLSPAVNSEIAAWVQNGGVLIYIGDNQDPYNRIPAWWNDNGKSRYTPLQHLFDVLGTGSLTPAVSSVSKGKVYRLNMNPAEICESANAENVYLNLVTDAISRSNDAWEKTNRFTLYRGPYVISAVMEESLATSTELKGDFVDLLQPDFNYLNQISLQPGQNALLFDLNRIQSESVEIIGTTGRILSQTATQTKLVFEIKTTKNVNSYLALANASTISTVKIIDDQGNLVANVVRKYDGIGYTTINYTGTGSMIRINILK
ncbi:hypothetical protein ACFQ4L_04545 [Lapidilactobacillus mulanensis]|uniref:Glycoside hydrolase family 42 N-terminal domain-containing protein n=2 Tax=Lapidilactobacillus mulanensis TaxID=2485999 RepID=A0ABW4DNI0_9LACO